MGEVRHVLTEDKYDADALPYAGRFVVEDNVYETVRVHIGHLRIEWTPEQFLWFADEMTKAAARYRANHAKD